jgi:hypothetical protein
MSGFSKQSASRQGAVQAIPYTATAAAFTGVFGPETYQIRLACTTACHYLISGGNAQAATAATLANGSLLPINWVEYVIVTPGQTLSVIQDSAAGTLNVTELS